MCINLFESFNDALKGKAGVRTLLWVPTFSFIDFWVFLPKCPINTFFKKIFLTLLEESIEKKLYIRFSSDFLDVALKHRQNKTTKTKTSWIRHQNWKLLCIEEHNRVKGNKQTWPANEWNAAERWASGRKRQSKPRAFKSLGPAVQMLFPFLWFHVYSHFHLINSPFYFKTS